MTQITFADKQSSEHACRNYDITIDRVLDQRLRHNCIYLVFINKKVASLTFIQ